MSSEAIADFATPKLLSSISTTSDTANLAETEKSEAHPPLVQILKGISCCDARSRNDSNFSWWITR